MDRVVYDAYLRRIADAPSVRDLHVIARELEAAHATDTDYATVDRACWAAAERLLATVHRRRELPDWKERASKG